MNIEKKRGGKVFAGEVPSTLFHSLNFCLNEKSAKKKREKKKELNRTWPK